MAMAMAMALVGREEFFCFRPVFFFSFSMSNSLLRVDGSHEVRQREDGFVSGEGLS